MTEDNELPLDAQLAALRRYDSQAAAQQIEAGLVRQSLRQKREVLAGFIGAAVAAYGTVHFGVAGDPITFVLACTALVMFWTAVRSARAVALPGVSLSGPAVLASWRKSLDLQIRHARLAIVPAVLFALLTAVVGWRHGLSNWRSLIYLVATLAVLVFAAYQHWVARPALERERSLLDEKM